jgi:hypothetical protein
VAERGSFQKGLDAVATGYRDHKGTVASAAVLAAGSGAAVARVEGATLVGAIGVAGLVVSSGIDYLNNVVARYMPDRHSIEQPPTPPDSETTLLTAQDLELTSFTEERPTAA